MHSPRVISLSLVKNEQDIIEPFIRHTAALVDSMIVIDNNSTDRTREILVACARELGNVVFADSTTFAYLQSEQMTRLLQDCQSAFFADFVLPLDADEFLLAEDRRSLREYLSTIPPEGVGFIPWRTFVPTPSTASEVLSDPPCGFRFRRAHERPQYFKTALRMDGKLRPSWKLEQGNHLVTCTAGREIPTRQLDDLALMHFPVRSAQQLTAKAVTGWMACIARDPEAHKSSLCYQWRQAFERATSDESPAPSEEDLCRQAMLYAQEPHAIDWERDVIPDSPSISYRRAYSDGQFASPLKTVVKAWQQTLIPPRTFSCSRPGGEARQAPSTASTAFDSEWGWENLFVDVAPFRFIAEKHRPKRVLDVGCGIGANLEIFRQFAGSSVLGIDGLPEDSVLLKNNEYVFHDLATPPPFSETFDMVVCTEVLEHLPPEAADHLLDWITRHATNTIVFSAAEPGQPGHQHINCRPIDHWLDLLAERGWSPKLTDTLGMRALSSLSWFRRNLLVLHPTGKSDGELAARQLKAVAQRRYQWYNQQPGIRQAPFTETVPDSGGYHG